MSYNKISMYLTRNGGSFVIIRENMTITRWYTRKVDGQAVTPTVNVYTMLMAMGGTGVSYDGVGGEITLIPKRKLSPGIISFRGIPATSGMWWLTFSESDVQIQQEINGQWVDVHSGWEYRTAVDFDDEGEGFLGQLRTVPLRYTVAESVSDFTVTLAYAPYEYVDDDPLQALL